MTRLVPSYPLIPLSDCKMMIVGEAPGKDEDAVGQPFVGKAGQLLTDLLDDAMLNRNNVFLTNVFMERPPLNKIDHFFISKKTALSEEILYEEDLPKYKGKYLRQQWRFELLRLTNEILEVQPKIIVALGSTAMWALTNSDKPVTTERSKSFACRLAPDFPVIVTLHPAYILRNKNSRSALVDDLRKAQAYF